MYRPDSKYGAVPNPSCDVIYGWSVDPHNLWTPGFDKNISPVGFGQPQTVYCRQKRWIHGLLTSDLNTW